MASCNNTLSGITNVAVMPAMRLFPNPASSELNIILPEPCTLSVFNATGQKIYHNPVANGNLSMDVSSFADGLYFLQTTGANGQLSSRRFTVAR